MPEGFLQAVPQRNTHEKRGAFQSLSSVGEVFACWPSSLYFRSRPRPLGPHQGPGCHGDDGDKEPSARHDRQGARRGLGSPAGGAGQRPEDQGPGAAAGSAEAATGSGDEQSRCHHCGHGGGNR